MYRITGLRRSALAVLAGMAAATGNAYAQFTPAQPSSERPESGNIEVVAVPPAQNGTPKVDIYSDAYDRQLRKERFKQRNTMKLTAGLTVTQTSFENWQKGGNNSFAGRATLYGEHRYTAPVFSVLNIFDAKYGLQRVVGQTRKTEDYVGISSTQNWNISQRWKLSLNEMWKSQFSNGYTYASDGTRTFKSTFMAPGTFEISGGFTYESPNKKLNILLAPISGKMTFVLNDELAAIGGFGPPKGDRFKTELGIMARIMYNEKIYKNKIEYATKFESFWNYSGIPAMWWENKLNFKFSDVLSANFYVLMIYDQRIITPKVSEFQKTNPGAPVNGWDYLQLNQSMGFGLVYTMKSKPREPIKTSTITRSRLKTLK